MNNKFLIIIFFGLLLLPLTSAYFVKDHLYWTINGFETVNSPITQKCQDKLDIVLDGLVATDIPVLHYSDEKFMSYVSTHTRGSGYLACMEEAGSDEDLQCFCIGIGLHNVQDHFAHTDEGLVPKYIKKYVTSNLVGHMQIEKNYENQHMDYLTENNNEIMTSGTLSYYNSIVCDNLFEETGGDYKYVELLNDLSDIDMRNDVNIFCNGYKGTGFYNTVYNQKLQLPWWFWGIGGGLIILGLTLSGFTAFTGRTRWKWVLVAMYSLIAVLGALILISLWTNNTWRWIEFLIELPLINILIFFLIILISIILTSLKTKWKWLIILLLIGGSITIYLLGVGVIRVSSQDIEYYHTTVQTATNNFLKTGNLIYDDNSGLSYVDRNGNKVKGALSEAEGIFNYLMAPIIIIVFASINAFLFYKTYKK